MITTDTMYNLHHVELDLKIKELQEEVNKLNRLRKSNIDFFTVNQSKINTSTLEEILKGNGKPMVEFQVFNKLYNIHLRNYNSYVHSYQSKVDALYQLENSVIKESVFKYVLKRFNNLIMDEIIYNAYKFNAFPIGNFFVGKHITSRKTIDWGKSDKAKAEVIASGNIPYIKADAEKALAEGIEYKGVPWISYLPSTRFYIFWRNNLHEKMRSNNTKGYSFDPTRSKGGVVRRFFDYIRDKSEEELTLKYETNAN